jgi:hypothetical protein
MEGGFPGYDSLTVSGVSQGRYTAHNRRSDLLRRLDPNSRAYTAGVDELTVIGTIAQ